MLRALTGTGHPWLPIGSEIELHDKHKSNWPFHSNPEVLDVLRAVIGSYAVSPLLEGVQELCSRVDIGVQEPAVAGFETTCNVTETSLSGRSPGAKRGT